MREMESGVLVLTLRDGEDALEGLRRTADEHRIRSGLILSGVGMMRELTLGYFKGGGEYGEVKMEGPVELTSMQGNIGMSEEGRVFHIHVTCGTDEGKVYGGHLVSGTVNVVNEIAILKLNRIQLDRELNPETGLLELRVTDRGREKDGD